LRADFGAGDSRDRSAAFDNGAAATNTGSGNAHQSDCRSGEGRHPWCYRAAEWGQAHGGTAARHRQNHPVPQAQAIRRIAGILANAERGYERSYRSRPALPQVVRSHTASKVGNVSLRKTSSISLGDNRILLSNHQFNTRTNVEAMYAETSSG
jgi:hypothetical protein